MLILLFVLIIQVYSIFIVSTWLAKEIRNKEKRKMEEIRKSVYVACGWYSGNSAFRQDSGVYSRHGVY